MKRVLVAGARGYLGGFVAQQSKSRGKFVRAPARSPEKLSSQGSPQGDKPRRLTSRSSRPL